MKLVIDIGNTRTKVGLFHKDDLLSVQTFDQLTIDFLENVFSEFTQIEVAIFSTVKEIKAEVFDFLKSKTKLFELSSKSVLPFDNKYETPETLGKDRIAGIAGGLSLMPNTNVLIIDAGTCITYDSLTSDKEYFGGGISPGIKMRFDAMHTFTDKLPLVPFTQEENAKLVGTTTESSMLSGVKNGILSEVDGIIDQYKEHFPDLKIIITGGDYKYFDKYLKNNIFASPNLVLIGLKKILDIDEDS